MKHIKPVLLSLMLVFLIGVLPSIFIISKAEAETVVKIGDYKLVTEFDKINNTSTSYIYTYGVSDQSKYGNKPFLGYSCSGAYFGGLNILNNGDFSTRTDMMDKPRDYRGNIWQGSDGTSYQKTWGRKPLREEIEKGHIMHVEFDTYAEIDQVVTFSLKGSTAALQLLETKCKKGI